MTTATPGQPATPPCPRCAAAHVVRNGANSAGTPTFRCRGCGRRFVATPREGPVPDERKALVERPLGERLSLRAVARVTGLSRSWLQAFVNDLYRNRTPWERGAVKKAGDLVIEADECWSSVGSRKAVWRARVALDADTRQVVAMVCGDRSERTARCLWDARPGGGRAAYWLTDVWAAYAAAVTGERHYRAAEGEGRANHVERFSATVRRRCARFVRRTLSFSKAVEGHVGSLQFFIRQYNLCHT